MEQNTPDIIELVIGLISGGAVVKLVELFLMRGEQKEDAAAQIRQELRDEIDKLQERVDNLSTELDMWKEKYFTLYEENITLKAQMKVVTEELERMRKKLEEVEGGEHILTEQ